MNELHRSVAAPPVRHVHLGLGNFFRAHQAWYSAHAPDCAQWGIAAFTGRGSKRSSAVAAALGDKRGIRRYGHGFHPKNPFTGEAYVPMDECLARCVVDFSGRPYLVWRGLDKFSQKKISDAEKIQDMSSVFRFGLAREFFQGFTNEARCNLHLELLYGDEPHHIVESLFKAFARAVDAARQHDPRIAGQLRAGVGDGRAQRFLPVLRLRFAAIALPAEYHADLDAHPVALKGGRNDE